MSIKAHSVLIVVILSLRLFALEPTCSYLSNAQKSPAKISETFKKSKIYACLESEAIDPITEPWRIQSFALNKCNQSSECVAFLRKKVSEFSGLEESRFNEMTAVTLWSKMHEYSGFFRKTPLHLQDLPLSENPIQLFNEIAQDKTLVRETNTPTAYRFACSAVFMIAGPAKAKLTFRAVEVAKSTSAVSKTTIILSHDAEKVLKKNQIPPQVRKKFMEWKERVEKEGIQEVRKTPGLHDEPLHGKLDGQRSIRLNQEFRVNYKIESINGESRIQILDIHAHKY